MLTIQYDYNGSTLNDSESIFMSGRELKEFRNLLKNVFGYIPENILHTAKTESCAGFAVLQKVMRSHYE